MKKGHKACREETKKGVLVFNAALVINVTLYN